MESDSQSPDASEEPILPGLSGWLSSVARQLGRLGYRVELTESELEQRLAKHYPWTGQRLGLSLTLAQPRLAILADGLLRLQLALRVAGKSVGREGSLQLAGDLRYEPATGCFFIGGVRVEELEIANWSRPLWPLRKALEPAMERYFRHNPVVELQPERRGHAVMKAVLERIETREGALHLHLRLIRTPLRR